MILLCEQNKEYQRNENKKNNKNCHHHHHHWCWHFDDKLPTTTTVYVFDERIENHACFVSYTERTEKSFSFLSLMNAFFNFTFKFSRLSIVFIYRFQFIDPIDYIEKKIFDSTIVIDCV